MKRGTSNKSNKILVGYLVNSLEVEGELEFRKDIGNSSMHLNLYYDLKKKFNIDKNTNMIVAKVEGQDEYHLLEPVYQNSKTNCLVYADTLNSTIYDFEDLSIHAPAYYAAITHIGNKESYSRNDIKNMLGKMKQIEKGCQKIK